MVVKKIEFFLCSHMFHKQIVPLNSDNVKIKKKIFLSRFLKLIISEKLIMKCVNLFIYAMTNLLW